MPSTAGRYIAEDRGAFDTADAEPSNEDAKPEVERKVATAPVIESVMLHMGPEEFSRFMRWYGGLD